MRIAPINAIKSISQRALVQHWREIAAGRHLPSLEQFAPPADTHDPHQLMFWTIEGADTARRFKTLQHGKYLSETFGRDPLPLQPMEDIVPLALQELAFKSLNACANARAPVYTIISTADAGGHRINCERLLLPFGDAQGEPRQIAVALQLITLDGKFTRETVLGHFTAAATLTLEAQISFDPANVPVGST